MLTYCIFGQGVLSSFVPNGIHKSSTPSLQYIASSPHHKSSYPFCSCTLVRIVLQAFMWAFASPHLIVIVFNLNTIAQSRSPQCQLPAVECGMYTVDDAPASCCQTDCLPGIMSFRHTSVGAHQYSLYSCRPFPRRLEDTFYHEQSTVVRHREVDTLSLQAKLGW